MPDLTPSPISISRRAALGGITALGLGSMAPSLVFSTEARAQPTPTEQASPGLPPSRSSTSGPHIILRFDDGYQSLLTNAAPLMARHGMVGVVFTNTGFAGRQRPGGTVLTEAETRTLHEDYGWEIGAHTATHRDALRTDIDTWTADLDQNIADLVSWGLPRPASFAYPNGSRTVETDKVLARRFHKVGLTGGPEMVPTTWDDPIFFSGWSAFGAGIPNRLQMAKDFIEQAFAEGITPIIGMHGVDEGSALVSYNIVLEEFTELIEWIADKRLPVGTMADTRNLNLLGDPWFEESSLDVAVKGSYPWVVSRSDSPTWTFGPSRGLVAGAQAAVLDTGGQTITRQRATSIQQRVPVVGGRTYRAWVNYHVERRVSGSCRLNLYFYDRFGAQLDSSTTEFGVVVMNEATSGETSASGEFTAPDAAVTVGFHLQTHTAQGFNGSILIGHVALLPVDQYDPIGAIAPRPAPADATGNSLEAGQETLPRETATDPDTPINSQLLRLAYMTATRTETIRSIQVPTGSTAAGPTPSLVRFGVYRVADNGDLTLIGSTPNDTRMLAAVHVPYVKTFSSPFEVVAGQRYAVAVLVVTNAATPTFSGVKSIAASNQSPRLSGAVPGQSDLPETIAADQVDLSSRKIYSVLQP